MAEDLEPVEADRAHAFARRLLEEAAAFEGLQVQIEGDADKAVGVHRPGEAGLILVPAKDLREGEEDEAVDSDPGAGMAYLFLSPGLRPVVNGTLVAADKLRTITISSDDGGEYAIGCLLLTARRLEGEQWRMYGFGTDEKPLIDASFTEGDGPGDLPLAVEVKGVEGQRGQLVLTVFGQFQAGFPLEKAE